MYKLAPHVTEEMLVNEGFKEIWCDRHDGHMLNRNINPQDEDDHIYVMLWVPFNEYMDGEQTRILGYNLKSRNEDMKPHIQDLIAKGLVVEE